MQRSENQSANQRQERIPRFDNKILSPAEQPEYFKHLNLPIPTEDSQPEVNTWAIFKKKQTAKKKRMAEIKQQSTISTLARAMRFFFIRGFKQQLIRGDIKSKFLHKFFIQDIISPKCFVVLPNENIGLVEEGKQRKLVFKMLKSDDIKTAYGYKKEVTDSMIQSMLDDWIYLAPKSKHIVSAYEIFIDEMFIMQLTEYCEGYENLYSIVKQQNLGSLKDKVPDDYMQLVFRYVIQISHAFMNAHKANLCHGDFDLSQVISNAALTNLKLINFRPWLIQTFQHASADVNFTKDELFQIAKARDLYTFGESIFDLLLGKTSKEDVTHKLEDQNTKSGSLKELNKRKNLNMPQLESIPFSWVQRAECSFLIEILHQCMVIDTKRDTVQIFSQIHQVASEMYKRLFDFSFKAFPDIRSNSDIQRNFDCAIGMNNRQVISRLKIQSCGLNKVVSTSQNRQLVAFQIDLLERACQFQTYPDEAMLNLFLHQWQLGNLFDDELCSQIQNKLYSTTTAQWVLLVFRRALGLPILPKEEDIIMKIKPSSALGQQIQDHYKEFALLKIPLHSNLEVPLQLLDQQAIQLKSQSAREGQSNQFSAKPEKIEVPKIQNVRKIFFSPNGQYFVIISDTDAFIIRIGFENFQTMAKIKLPSVEKESVPSPPASRKDLRMTLPTIPDLQLNENASNQAQADTVGDSGNVEQEQTRQKFKVEPELHEADPEDNRKQIECHGFFNSNWLAAIDDEGKFLVLHDMGSVSLVKRDLADDQIDYCSGHTQRIFTADQLLARKFPGMKLSSELIVYSGKNFNVCNIVDIGRQCPDEILDLEFQEHQEISVCSDTTFPPSDNASKSQPNLMQANDIKPEQQSTSHFFKGINEQETQNALKHPGSFGSRNELLTLDKKHFTASLSQHTYRSVIVLGVRCKDLMQYNLAIDGALTGEDLFLTKAPEPLEGGAALPVAMFNHPFGTPKEKQQILRQEKTPSILMQLKKKHSIGQPSYTLSHYEHIKEFIEKHEKLGNPIRFAKNNNQYAVGYQSSYYKGRKPHFFIYDIQQRSVVRRFLPTTEFFSLLAVDLVVEEQFVEGINKQVKEKHVTEDSQELFDAIKRETKGPLPNFEISPNGHFMVYSHEGSLCLKQLTAGIPEYFCEVLKPSYMAEEHQEAVVRKQQNRTDQAKELDSPKNKSARRKNNVGGEDLPGPTIAQEKEWFDTNSCLSEQLLQAQQEFNNFIGSTQIKHQRFCRLHFLIAKALAEPDLLQRISSNLLNMEVKKIIVRAFQKGKMKKSEDQHKKNTGVQSNFISKRALKQCFQAIQMFHYNYSVLTNSQPQTASTIVANHFSEKIAVKDLKLFTTFDGINFRNNSEKIRRFQLCSHPRNWLFAVNYSRVLQIYDQNTGDQLFELVVPSAKTFSFIDNEQCIIVQDGLSTIVTASILSQRKAFINKGSALKAFDDVKVQEVEGKNSDYIIGIAKQRKHNKYSTDNEESEEDERDDFSGVRTLKWDEEILNLTTARNTAAVGYFALIGRTKMSIFLVYAEDENCSVDHVWTINNTEFLGQNWSSIKVLDFSTNCENFVAYTNTGVIGLWDIKKNRFERKVYTVRPQETPVTAIRSVANSSIIVTYSRPLNLFLVIDALGLQNIAKDQNPEDFVKRIQPLQNFGSQANQGLNWCQYERTKNEWCMNFQIDNSEQYLICAMNYNKIIIFSLKTGQQLLIYEDQFLNTAECFIDETCCFLATVDETLRKTNIYTLEWLYKINPPIITNKKTKEQELEELMKKTVAEEQARLQRLATMKKSKFCAIF